MPSCRQSSKFACRQLKFLPTHRYGLVVSTDPAMTSGSRLKAIRKSKGLTQQGLARLVGKTRSQIAEWEGDTLPDEDNRKLLAGVLKVAPEQIGPAWNPESPRAGRHVQQSHNPPQQNVAAPPQLPTGADMGPGDQGLVFVQRVWGILTPDLQQDLVEHARELAHKATAPTGTPRKKAVR